MTSKEDKPYKKKNLQEDMKKALQEKDIIGIYPYRKMTSQKRQPYKKTGRRPYWNMTSGCLASQSFTELGPAQPQLVFIYNHYLTLFMHLMEWPRN